MTRVFSLRSRAGLLAVLLLLTGCDPILRFYGDDYGNTEAHQRQIQILVDNFDASLQRNQADLVRLAGATAGNPSLVPYTERMTALVATQEVVLAEQREWIEGLDDEDDYRELNRHYGAFITQQQMIADRYDDLTRRMAGDTLAATYVDAVVDGSRYALVPPQYDRISNRMRTPALPLEVAPAATPAVPLPDDVMTTQSDTTTATQGL